MGKKLKIKLKNNIAVEPDPKFTAAAPQNNFGSTYSATLIFRRQQKSPNPVYCMLQSYGSCLYAGSQGSNPATTVCRQVYRQAKNGIRGCCTGISTPIS